MILEQSDSDGVVQSYYEWNSNIDVIPVFPNINSTTYLVYLLPYIYLYLGRY